MRGVTFLLLIAAVMPIPLGVAAPTATAREVLVPHEAKGIFDVKIVPVSGPDEALGRFSLDKSYHGDLDASGTGQMMASNDAATQIGVYVAIEKVAGTLKGRKGSFLLAHRGMRSAEGQDLNVVIVPGSGTDALAGISGDLEITIEAGKHSYILRYNLPAG